MSSLPPYVHSAGFQLFRYRHSYIIYDIVYRTVLYCYILSELLLERRDLTYFLSDRGLRPVVVTRVSQTGRGGSFLVVNHQRTRELTWG